MTTCAGIRADGGRCRAQAIRNSEWCFNHHPNYTEARKQRASKGGERGGRGRPIAELQGVKGKLEDLAEDVLEGRKDRGDAAVAGQLYNTLIRAIGMELKVREQLEIEERIAELEALLAQREAS